MSEPLTVADQADIRRQNMEHLQLDAAQYERHRGLMKTGTLRWPAGLAEHVRGRARKERMSREALETWVAEWIRLGEPGEALS